MLDKKSTSVIYNCCGQDFHLLPDSTLFWTEKQTLIVSDLHIGKVMHFRKSGFPVPLSSFEENLEKLSFALLSFPVKRCIFLGDLFHSTENAETDLFWTFCKDHNHIDFVLIKGNHDVHSAAYFEKHGVQTVDRLEETPFVFTHEPLAEKEDLYNLAGHIHPAVKMRGKAKSYIKLPCFYFGQSQGILPAFGVFTGTHAIKPQPSDHVFVILNEEKVVKV